MHSAISSIGKNLILLGLVALSAINFFYGWLSWQDLLIVQSLTGLAYIFLSCYEFLNAQYRAQLPVKRYSYFTNKYVMFKALKMGVFVSFAALLYLAGNNIKYLYPVCILIAITEGLVMYMKYKRGIYFVSISIYANYLMFSDDKLVKLFASQIELVEFRHDIFYFVKKDKKSLQIKMVHIQDRENFLQSINEWLVRNKVRIGNESATSLKQAVETVS
ncbi:MAG: hypothetical protein K0S32_3951 [Bacteroidetes bacterium]|jgi:hypothetical protein|nr:hypothetical protein [Bacteroidota bacterium]